MKRAASGVPIRDDDGSTSAGADESGEPAGGSWIGWWRDVSSSSSSSSSSIISGNVVSGDYNKHDRVYGLGPDDRSHTYVGCAGRPMRTSPAVSSSGLAGLWQQLLGTTTKNATSFPTCDDLCRLAYGNVVALPDTTVLHAGAATATMKFMAQALCEVPVSMSMRALPSQARTHVLDVTFTVPEWLLPTPHPGALKRMQCQWATANLIRSGLVAHQWQATIALSFVAWVAGPVFESTAACIMASPSSSQSAAIHLNPAMLALLEDLCPGCAVSYAHQVFNEPSDDRRHAAGQRRVVLELSAALPAPFHRNTVVWSIAFCSPCESKFS